MLSIGIHFFYVLVIILIYQQLSAASTTSIFVDSKGNGSYKKSYHRFVQPFWVLLQLEFDLEWKQETFDEEEVHSF